MTQIQVEEYYMGAGDIYVDSVFFGSTRENNVFRVVQEMAAPYVNGAGGILAQTDYHNRFPAAELEVTLLELDDSALAYAIPGAAATTVGEDSVISPPTARRLASTDYHSWELRVPGLNSRLIKFTIPIGIASSNPEFVAQDDGEQPLGPRLTIMSRIDPDSIETAQWTITRTPASYS